MFDINKYVRPNIRQLKPYSSAREEYKGKEAVFLDANENPYNAPYNRYPDPLQTKLKEKISELKNISSDQLFLGNGSDEAIDLLIRIFCSPGKDSIIIADPTYGMYKVCADINNINVLEVSLTEDFQPDATAILEKTDENSKIIMLCSPNNPTGNSFDKNKVLKILDEFNGIVVIDEAYIDFSVNNSYINVLDQYNNLVVLQTFSKAWGMAGIRLGMAIASPDIINYLNKIKYPYNVNCITQEIALKAISNKHKKDKWVSDILAQREYLANKLSTMAFVKKIYPTDANFFLVKVDQPKNIYNYLVNKKIIVRDRSNVNLCEGCLRFTVGTPKENKTLINALNKYETK
jgi:histidinol-phosphate aminotransferase